MEEQSKPKKSNNIYLWILLLVITFIGNAIRQSNQTKIKEEKKSKISAEQATSQHMKLMDKIDAASKAEYKRKSDSSFAAMNQKFDEGRKEMEEEFEKSNREMEKMLNRKITLDTIEKKN